MGFAEAWVDVATTCTSIALHGDDTNDKPMRVDRNHASLRGSDGG